MLGLKNLTTAKRLGLLVFIFLLSLAAVMTTSAMTLRGSLDGERKLKTRNVVEGAYGLLEHFHGLALRGALTQDEAKAAAITAIKAMRYDGDHYFWINDFRPRMVMHPLMPELDGADLSDDVDSTGKRLFVEIVETAREGGAGFVEYHWSKPGTSKPLRKISYVKAFVPWGWILGSGVYLDDIDALYWRQAASNTEVLMVIACVFGFLAWRVVRSVLAPLGGEPMLVAEMANRVADGDRAVRLESAEGDTTSVVYAMTRMVQRLRHDVEIAEEGLAQASKLDAIGRLAGGIAHDFNNLLVVVLGCVDALREKLPTDHALREEVNEIDEAAHRAASLTRQLLAFGRRDVNQPVALELGAAVSEASRMLRRLVGEDVEIAIRADPEPAVVVVDSARLQQVIVNLVLNARDAMPQGGTVTIETRRSALAEGHPVLPRGEYAVLAIRDTGCGMTAEVQQHLFEPFFTTKREGRGTGLGLATVFGIVKQVGGHVEVESAPGAGSCFTVLLPSSARGATSAERAPSASPREGRGETILLVEDEPAVLKRAAGILERAGYRVVAASGPDAALGLHDRGPHAIDLLLTDVIMPRMSGPQLAATLLSRHPELRVVFMSGYTDEYVSRDGTRWEGVRIVEKPFEPRTLLMAVGDALEAGRCAASG